MGPFFHSARSARPLCERGDLCQGNAAGFGAPIHRQRAGVVGRKGLRRVGPQYQSHLSTLGRGTCPECPLPLLGGSAPSRSGILSAAIGPFEGGRVAPSHEFIRPALL
jgi:hypothetical protein